MPERHHHRRLAVALGAAVVIVLPVLAACGDDGGTATATTTTSEPCRVVDERKVTIVADDLAWDTACIQAPEGVPFAITVDNRDAGVAHDLHLKGAPGEPATDLVDGPVEQELVLPALAAGSYVYICDVHTNIRGELQVLPPLPEGTVIPLIPTTRP